MDASKRRTYWDTFETPYQMGPQTHRLYLLNKLKEVGVKSILDVGCGTGPIYQIIRDTTIEIIDEALSVFPKYDFKYKGTDYSPAMIEIAKEQFPEAEFEVEDARALVEPHDTWDCVLLMHCLDHLDDYKAAINEAARVTKKYVCIVLWRGFVNEGTHLNDRNMMGKQEGEKPWEDTYLHEYSRESLEEAFKEANLKVVHTAEGEALNGDGSHYNFLFLLEKQNEK